jgi:membrane protease YdiL (CAAX protease family)
MAPRLIAPILTGLAVAWGGTLLIGPVERLFGAPDALSTNVIGQVLFWSIAGCVIAIVWFWERESLRSLWLKPLRWQSIAWGLALTAVNWTLLFPVGEFIRRTAGLPGFEMGMTPVIAMPLWYRIWAVLGAGILEELLFRGYTVTRLTMLIGRPWMAAAIAVLGFALIHVPHWGWGFAVGGLFGGAVAMAFFLWRRDLVAMMVFHTITDAAGLIIAPMYSDWWLAPGSR